VKWARFRSIDGRIGFGVFDGECIAEFAGDMFGTPRATGRTLAAGEFALASPCLPSKIVALWNNFTALSVKLGKAPPSHPLFLLKPGTSVIGPNEPIRRPAGYSGKIAYEGELGIVIGKLCKDVARAAAREHIFGYTCVNDVTASGVLNENVDFAQWCRSKGYDTFGCLGPIIATDLDWLQLRVITRVDGAERQNYPLSDMIMPPEELVSRISHDMSLLPGDVIACGTSVGVGSIKEGGSVEVQIDGIGTLVNTLSPGAR
jgi:2-keto-4-pentenoate hydratase/2-oxohepta-3-ene-1,7-dioic acid hydratase in catechol pathway